MNVATKTLNRLEVDFEKGSAEISNSGVCRIPGMFLAERQTW